MAPKCAPDLKDVAAAHIAAPPAKRTKAAVNKGGREMNRNLTAALRASAGGAPIPRKAADVAKVTKKLAQSRQADPDDDEFDTDSVEDDVVRLSRPPRIEGARKKPAADAVSTEAEFEKRVEAAVMESLKEKQGRRKASATKVKSLNSTASTTTGRAVSKCSHRGGRRVRERRARKEKKEAEAKHKEIRLGSALPAIETLDISDGTDESSGLSTSSAETGQTGSSSLALSLVTQAPPGAIELLRSGRKDKK